MTETPALVGLVGGGGKPENKSHQGDVMKKKNEAGRSRRVALALECEARGFHFRSLSVLDTEQVTLVRDSG